MPPDRGQELLVDRRARALRLGFWALGVGLAVLHGWESRHQMNVDGVSYVDVADAYLAGDWTGAINGHWSPLYSWVLALALVVVQPTPFWEFAVVHGVNVAIFVGALAAFDLFLRDVMMSSRVAARDDAAVRMPAWLWVAIGYPLFLWSSLHLVSVWVVTPDLMVAGFVYLAMALVLRIWRQPRLRTFVTLGAVLGFAYLAKAPMLPLGLVVLATAAFALRSDRRAMARYTAAALVALMVVATPFIVALSLQKGRLTFGDSRVISYAWLVNQVPFRNWQGGQEAGGVLKHPTRKLTEHPAAYEFSVPVRGTYPVWYDPSYWLDGVEPVLRWRDHARNLIASAREYQGIFLGSVQAGVIAALALCLYVSWPWERTWVAPVVLVPAVAGLALYSAVLVMPRYVGPFVVLWWIALVAWIRLPPGRTSERLISGAGVLICTVLLAATALAAGPRAYKGGRELLRGQTGPSEPFTVASAVHAAGIRAGDRVAIVYPPPEAASVARLVSWARVARVTIAAEVPPEASRAFWTADPAALAQLIDRLRDAGVRGLVTMNIPDARGPSRLDGWSPVAGTPFAVFPVLSR